MYKAILFDLDDTLINLRGCEAEALQRTLGEAELLALLPSDYGSVSASFAEISGRYWGQRSDTGYTRDQVLQYSLRDLLVHYQLDAAESVALAPEYWRNFCHSSALNPAALDTVRQLSQHYRLGVITNGYIDSQRGRLDAAGLTQFFDPILISEEVGFAKPEVRIFKMALAHLGLRPEAVLYVGDSISHDREGCLRAGIDFCHFCPQHSIRDDLPGVKLRVARLEELIGILMPGLTP